MKSAKFKFSKLFNHDGFFPRNNITQFPKIGSKYIRRHLRADSLSLLLSALRPRLVFVLLFGIFIFAQNACASEASAASMTLTVPAAITLDVQPTGTLAKSSASSFSAKTDGAWGYNLSIKAKSTTDMVNGSAKLAAISKNMTESEYQAAGNNNTWGFIPSILNSTENTSFIAATTSATVLDKTSAANASSAKSYSITLGAKADSTLPNGSYSNTMVLTISANTTSYNITYNLNSGSWSGTSPQTGNTTGTTITLDSHSPTKSSYEFQGWCSVAVTSNDSASPSCSGTTYKPSASYDLTKNAKTATLYAMWKSAKPATPPTTMQNFGSYCAWMSEHQTLTLKDARDNNSYTVAKLNDGKCWMTQNLRLGDSKLSNHTLTSANTNITSNYTLPASSASGFSSGSAENVYVGGSYNSGYYTWNAATAGTGNSISSGEAPGSICPKGWKLPTFDEIKALVNKNGGFNTSGASSYLIAAPANFVLPGYNDSGSFYHGGSKGQWWSSSALRSENVWTLYVETSRAYWANEHTRFGFSIRCIAAQ